MEILELLSLCSRLAPWDLRLSQRLGLRPPAEVFASPRRLRSQAIQLWSRNQCAMFDQCNYTHTHTHCRFALTFFPSTTATAGPALSCGVCIWQSSTNVATYAQQDVAQDVEWDVVQDVKHQYTDCYTVSFCGFSWNLKYNTTTL